MTKNSLPFPSEETREWDELAEHYHEDVITPFSPEVDFPLAQELEGIVALWEAEQTLPRRRVFDFGIGCGESLELIAGTSGLSIGVDFSQGMLAASAERLQDKNIETQRVEWGDRRGLQRLMTQSSESPQTALVHGDMRDLSLFREAGDLVMAINSITTGDRSTSSQMFRECAAAVKPGGVFLAVFPSWDTMDHLEALLETAPQRPPGLGEMDPDGIYVDAEGGRQKFWRPDEIRSHANDAGLVIEGLAKIEYPWSLVASYGWGEFPEAPPLWDWFLRAHRPHRSPGDEGAA